MSPFALDITSAVAVVSARSRIAAPASTVWDVLLDFPSYPLWNPFVRAQAITNAAYKPLLAHAPPKEGDHLLVRVRIPPRRGGLHEEDDRGLQTSRELVNLVDAEHHRVGWCVVGYPTWLLRSQRLQELVEERVDGRTTTVYTTTETFHGLAAWLIRWFMHKNLTISFQAMADTLKARSEELTNTRPA